MTDELNGESGFEFIEKKLEEFSTHNDAPIADAVNTIINTESLLTADIKPMVTENVLSNIAPPSILPSFITNSMPIFPNILPNQSQGLLKNKSMKILLQDAKSIEQTTVNSDKMLQVFMAPDSSTIHTKTMAGSLFKWVKNTVTNSNVLSKVAKQAKNSVNSMITTLDPQMREFIYSSGDIEIMVATDKESKVPTIREAFQYVFGNVIVNESKIDTAFDAIEPIGFAAGVKAAQEKITAIRNNSSVLNSIPIIAVQNFFLEVDQEKWYDLGVIILEDLNRNINLQIFTQMTPVPNKIVETAQKSITDNYIKDSLTVSIGNFMASNLQVSHTEWHSTLTGISKKDIIFLAAQSLAGIYKNTINSV